MNYLGAGAPAFLALALAGACGGPQDNTFYGKPSASTAAGHGGTSAGAGSTGGDSAGNAVSAGSSGGGAGGTGGNGGVSGAGGGAGGVPTGGAGNGVGGVGGQVLAAGNGGVAGTDSAGAAGAAGAEGGAGGEAPVDCSAHGDQARGFDGHCYRYDATTVTFNQAVGACEDDGAHLVTISSEGRRAAEFLAENAFVWQLAGAAPSWLGATDGKGPHAPGDGTFFKWLTGEPMTFDNWSGGQPNNSQSSCQEGHPCSCDDGACYEHCGFQWDQAGREMDAVPGWNDRVCDHVLSFVCEWDAG